MSSGRPVAAVAAGDLASRAIVPTTRLTLRIGSVGLDLLAALERGRAERDAAWWRRATPRSCAPARSGRSGRVVLGTWGWKRIRLKSRLWAFQWSIARRISSRSEWPTISSKVRKPSWAMCSRTSWATKVMKLTTYCGSPVKRLRSSGSCVAMPTGQVLRWQARIITQPSVTSGAVAKPNSSAPSSAPITTSRPVFSWPSTSTATRERRSFMSRTWWVSAMPSSQGRPACLIEDSGEAPVPPSWPLIRITSAWALATPAAIVPTPTSATSFTRDAGVGVGVLEVVDQLGQVLDGVDVVVRRRADQAHARRRVADLGDPGVDLVAGQLAALAGLGALGHLDLDLAGADQVLAGDAEAARGDLLDGALQRVAVGQRLEAGRVLAALAGVRLAAEAVHRDGQRLVGLRARWSRSSSRRS